MIRSRPLLPALLLALFVAPAMPVFGQVRLDVEVQLDSIDSIISVIDALAPIREQVLSASEPFADEDVETMLRLGEIAALLGAADLAAEARLLATFARRPGDGSRVLRAPEMLLTPGRQPRFDWSRTQLITNIAAAAGAVTLTTSAVLHYLSEQRYERYLASDPRDDTLWTEFRQYDLLGSTFGFASIAILGVGVPLAFAAPDLWSAGTTAPGRRATYTKSERDALLAELLRERQAIAAKITALGDRNRRRITVPVWAAGVGAIGAISGVTFFFIADRLYDQYLGAQTSDEATKLRGQVELFDLLAVIGGGVTIGGFGTAIGVEVFTTDRAELERRLARVNQKIIDVRVSPVIQDRAPAAGKTARPAADDASPAPADDTTSGDTATGAGQ